MSHLLVCTTLFLATVPVAAVIDEPEHSELEQELERAQGFLSKAETYTCQRDTAPAALAPARARFEKLRAEATAVLSREPNLDIRLNSCRRAGDGPEFRILLNKANIHLRKAERMIRRERAN